MFRIPDCLSLANSWFCVFTADIMELDSVLTKN